MTRLPPIGLALAIAVAGAVFAEGARTAHAAAQETGLPGAARQVVDQVNSYFNAIDSMKGEFTQISPKGDIASGVFVISKPGKMRFEYAPPSPLLVVSDGRWVVVRDIRKKHVDQYPLSATPLRLVLDQDVNLLSEAKVLQIETRDNVSSITIEDRDPTVSGQLTLVFDRAANRLQQWIIVDGKGQRTSIQLQNVEEGVTTDPQLFVVDRPGKALPGADRLALLPATHENVFAVAGHRIY